LYESRLGGALECLDRALQDAQRAPHIVNGGPDATLPRKHRLPALLLLVLQPADSVKQPARQAGNIAILRVDEERNLLGPQDQLRLEIDQPFELLAKDDERAGNRPRRLLVHGDVAIEMVDEHIVEDLLALEERRDHRPEVRPKPTPPAPAKDRRCAQQIPTLVEGRNPLRVVRRRRGRHLPQPLNRPVESRQRVVVMPIRFLAFASQPGQIFAAAAGRGRGCRRCHVRASAAGRS